MRGPLVSERKSLTTKLCAHFADNTNLQNFHCVKSVCFRSISWSHFPTFGPNTERCGVSLRIQSKCGKIGTRKTPNTDTFHAVFNSCVYSIYRQARSLRQVNFGLRNLSNWLKVNEISFNTGKIEFLFFY